MSTEIDRIHEPESETPVVLPPEIEAALHAARKFDAYATSQNWQALKERLDAVRPAAEDSDLVELVKMAVSESWERESALRHLDALLERRRPPTPEQTFRPVSAITDALPRPILRAKGLSGAVLAEGAVCLLSGAGGSAKSTLAGTIALDVAYGGDSVDEHMASGFSRLFDVRSGGVLIGSYEDPAAFVSWRLRHLAEARDAPDGVLDRIQVAHMAGLPLYGPSDSSGGLYTARPERLRGWTHLWESAEKNGARLVIIDPALDAYVGEGNNLAAVREFVSALGAEARRLRCGVLLVAHSNKDARRGNDPFDPGQVGGASAWTDAARAVLTLTGSADERKLAIAKANWGRAFVLANLLQVERDAALVGFDADPAGWQSKKQLEERAYDPAT